MTTTAKAVPYVVKYYQDMASGASVNINSGPLVEVFQWFLIYSKDRVFRLEWSLRIKIFSGI